MQHSCSMVSPHELTEGLVCSTGAISDIKMYGFEIGELVRAPSSREGHWWSLRPGLVVGYEDWGQNNISIVVLMQKNNKRCTFHPNSLEKVNEPRDTR